MGFCLFNNIAVAAAWLRSHHGLERIAIIDLDLHHGNGTQAAFYNSPHVLYVSTHQYPYYPGTGNIGDVGSAEGRGYTVNFPLPAGTGDGVFVPIYTRIVPAILTQFHPRFVLVSAGFDTYLHDPLGSMAVTTEGFAYMTHALRTIAEEICGGRLLLCLEGGYNLTGLKESVLACLGELSGKSLLSADKLRRFAAIPAPENLFKQVQNIANHYWNL